MPTVGPYVGVGSGVMGAVVGVAAGVTVTVDGTNPVFTGSGTIPDFTINSVTFSGLTTTGAPYFFGPNANAPEFVATAGAGVTIDNYLMADTEAAAATYQWYTSADALVSGETDKLSPPAAAGSYYCRKTQAGRTIDTNTITIAAVTAWTPAAITTTLWLDASDAGTLTYDTLDITDWDDKSGNTNHFTHTTGDEPVDGGAINSLNTVDLGGSARLTSTMVEAASEWSVFVVGDHSSTAGLGYIFDIQSGRMIFAMRRTGTGPSVYDGAWQGSSAAVTGQHIWGFVAADGGAIYVDGASVHSITSWTDTAFGGTTALGSGYSGVFPAETETGEIVIVAGKVTDTIREKMEGYLAHKWGLTSVLDGAHPYKSTAPTT